VGILALIFVAAFFSRPLEAQRKASSPYPKVLALYLEGKYNQAQRILGKVLKKDWHNYDYLLLAAYVSWRNGQDRWVVTNFRRAMDLKPQKWQPYHGLIQYYIHKGELAKADKWSRKMSQTFGKNWRTWYLRASVAFHQGRNKRAITYAERSINLKSQNPQAYNLLGLIYLKQKKWSMADVAFKSARSFRPNSPYIWNNLGVVAEKKKDFAKAKQYYQKAVELLPKHPTAKENLERVSKKAS
jgi:Flp pilus assembly protein TadD